MGKSSSPAAPSVVVSRSLPRPSLALAESLRDWFLTGPNARLSRTVSPRSQPVYPPPAICPPHASLSRRLSPSLALNQTVGPEELQAESSDPGPEA
ncbi:hypothetical protein AK830_g6383 [Neonectria ditissima]|uniref:Uncharacterized protein n=1 Tax=Neonectria ditissima TaxID=78410 RepID=A0A0P7BIL9_9HYPO|nr:hypothetical protein AK830_g6383 [Neonectria ditissima]